MRIRLSKSRQIEVGLLLGLIALLIGLGIWWRKREWQEYWAESASWSGGASFNANSGSVDDLIDDFTSASFSVRTRAIELLAAKGTDAVPRLVKALQSEDSQTRKLAALTLGRIGPSANSALPDLYDALKDSDAAVLQESLASLKSIGVNSEVGVAAIARLLNSENSDTRRLAVSALATANEASVSVLTSALEHDDPATRLHAAIELAQISPDSSAILPVLLDALKEERSRRNNTALSALRSLGLRPVPGLIEMLRDHDTVARQSAAEFLGKMNPPPLAAIPGLIQCLKDSDAPVKSHAMLSLQNFGPDAIDAVPQLFELLDDEDWSFRARAPRAISKIDPENRQLVERLIQQIRRDVNSSVHREAAVTLGQMGEIARIAIPALQEASQNDEDHVQTEAARALWQLTGDPDAAFPGLRSVLKSQRRHQDALEVIRELGPSAKPLVPDLLEAYRMRGIGVTDRRHIGEVVKSLDAQAARREGIP